MAGDLAICLRYLLLLSRYDGNPFGIYVVELNEIEKILPMELSRLK